MSSIYKSRYGKKLIKKLHVKICIFRLFEGGTTIKFLESPVVRETLFQNFKIFLFTKTQLK